MSTAGWRFSFALGACAIGLGVALGMVHHQPSATRGRGTAVTVQHAFIDDDVRTTAADIALGNLAAQIAQLERLALRSGLSPTQGAALVELRAAHGQYTGSIADRERALAVAEDLARRFPTDPAVLLARARGRSAFHGFAAALDDIDRAADLGASSIAVDDLRAAIYQALGRYDEALAIRRVHAQRDPNSETLGALASLHAQRGSIPEAARLFEEARWSYRDVSPLPLAFLFFDEGSMWMRHGDLGRAEALFEAALRRVPGYAAARCRLAEVDAALGRVDQAIALLEPLARTADDPEAAALLARFLTTARRDGEARAWRETAARRYDELLVAHPDAYGPHAAEFWLTTEGHLASGMRLSRYAPAERRVALVSW